MKKRTLILLVSLFSLSSVAMVSCNETNDSSSNLEQTEKPTSDPYADFEDPSSEEIISNVILNEYKEKNYVYDQTVSNENGSVAYEIFVRSFYDYDGDGIGDFLGVKEKLPYLQDLGVKTIWLMPIHESPSYHGYDVIDYYGVNSQYGTMSDFEELLVSAEEYNIDVMIDIVFNHS